MSFLDSLTQGLNGQGRATSGYRSPEEQDQLHAQGATPLKGGDSPHNRGTLENPGAVDIGGIGPGQEDSVRARVESITGRKVARVLWETGQGRNQGTGQHYHIEFEDGTTMNAPSGSGVPTTQIPDVTTIQPSSGEVAAMNQPRNAMADPFSEGLTQALGGAVEEESQRLGVADQILQSFVTESAQVRSSLEDTLSTTIEAKRAINDQTRAHLQSLMNTAEPVFARREAAARQLLELDNMNPLEQTFRSLFDPNYNRQALRADIRSQEQALGALDQVFNERLAHAQMLTQLANADYADQEAMANLVLQNGGEDVRLALQSFNLAGQQIDTLLTGLKVDSSLIAARQQAREDILSGMTIGQINTKLAEAQASELGVAEVNGVPLRMGELQNAQLRFQDQAISVASAQLAIAQGNQELETAHKKKVLESMTMEDLKNTIRGGYEFQGLKFTPEEITGKMATLQRSSAVIAAQQEMESAGGIAGQMWRQIGGTMRIQSARFTSLFGQVPQEMTRFSQTVQAETNRFMTGLEQAKQLGVQDTFIAEQLPVLQSLIEQQNKVVSNTVKLWAGGNKDVEAMGMAWMTGQPIESNTAIKALIHFARNGKPAGTRFDGTAAVALRIAQEEIMRMESPALPTGGADDRGSPSFESFVKSGGELSKAEREQALVTAIQQRLTSEYNSQLGLDLFMSAPQVASEMKHPFSRVSQDQFTMAVDQGDRFGLESTARQLDMRPDEFMQMLANGESSALWQERVKGLRGVEANFSFWSDQLAVNQLMGTLKYLDSIAADTGFIPSREFTSLITSPQFGQAAFNTEKFDANGSFGGFMANAAGGAGFTQNTQDMTLMARRAYATYTQGRAESRARRITALASDPIERAQFILSGVEGLSPAHERLILTHVQQLVGDKVRAGNAIERGPGDPMDTKLGFSQDATERFAEANRVIDSFIMSGNPEDPALKEALGIARRQYQQLVRPMDQVIQRSAVGGH